MPPVPTTNLKGDIRGFSWTLFSTSPRRLVDSPVPTASPPDSPSAQRHPTQRHCQALFFPPSTFACYTIITASLPPHGLPPAPRHLMTRQMWQIGDRAPPGPRSQLRKIFWREVSKPFSPTTTTKEHPIYDTQNCSVQKSTGGF